MATGRMIWSFEKEISKAQEIAGWLRERGFSTRIYQRTVRAEMLCLHGYVIVTDAAATVGRPDYQLPGAR